jgi:hypothetical protein
MKLEDPHDLIILIFNPVQINNILVFTELLLNLLDSFIFGLMFHATLAEMAIDDWLLVLRSQFLNLVSLAVSQNRGLLTLFLDQGVLGRIVVPLSP